jgi:hypothetical protein
MNDVAELKKTVMDIVTDRYQGSEWEPLLLADLGTLVGQNGKRMGDGRPGWLKRFLERELTDKLRIIRHPDIKPYVAVCPVDKIDEAEAKLIGKKVKSSQGVSPSGFPRSLLIAFCRTIPDGSKIAYSRSRPYHYEIGPGPFGDNLIEIGEEYRLPGIWIPPEGGLPLDEQAQLRERIERWAIRHNVDLTQTSSEASFAPVTPPRSAQSTNALMRLLESLPSHLRSELRVPADIIEILLRHS